MSVDELHRFLAIHFPQVSDSIHIEELGNGFGKIRYRVGGQNLRPGGTVAGPTMFLLADVSIYVLVLAAIGPRELAVTTNCSIDFMRRPAPDDLLAHARLLKLGRRLAVGDVLIYSAGMAEPVARAGVTYSIPVDTTR
ncbi:MAG: PaaI family thioesterase [Rhodobacteraceae bacterium]|nr:PaaI family thioesterase [Paracoccaceae bacterium]